MTLYVASPWSPWEVDSLPAEMAKDDARPDRFAWLAGGCAASCSVTSSATWSKPGARPCGLDARCPTTSDEAVCIYEELAASLGLV